ncbi:MAG: hypothetical protein II820_08725 [Ruminiclostridium sp.]|nr:hypothetical protein [Ruminiclostridium sp.]
MISVGRVMEQSAQTYATQPKSSEQISEKKSSTLAADSTDNYVKSGASFTPAYTKATVTDNRSGTTHNGTSPDSNAQAQLEKRRADEAEQKKIGNADVPKFANTLQAKNDLMKDMVRNMFRGQVDNEKKTGPMKELDEILSSFGEEEHEADYWGAEKTANRILDFAKELAGDDNEMFDTLKNAFETAFSDSEKLYGGNGKLPSVSYETYDRVQKGFDDWARRVAADNAPAATH